MMTVRELVQGDYVQAMRLHEAMGADYALDLERPDFIVKNGVFDDERLVTVVLGRVTTEAYMLLDRTWRTPQDRMNYLLRLVDVSGKEAKLYGIMDCHVWIPPSKSCFGRRLKRMGFVPANWECLVGRL